MASDVPAQPRRRSRRWVAVLVIAIALVAALAAFTMRRGGDAAAAEDCEKKPPPNTFAIAGCDEGAAPAGAPPDTPAKGRAPAVR